MQISEISMANSRQNIRKLVKDGFVIRKPQKVGEATQPKKPDLIFRSIFHIVPLKLTVVRALLTIICRFILVRAL